MLFSSLTLPTWIRFNRQNWCDRMGCCISGATKIQPIKVDSRLSTKLNVYLNRFHSDQSFITLHENYVSPPSLHPMDQNNMVLSDLTNILWWRMACVHLKLPFAQSNTCPYLGQFFALQIEKSHCKAEGSNLIDFKNIVIYVSLCCLIFFCRVTMCASGL